MAIFPKVIKDTGAYRLVWTGVGTVAVEADGGTDATGVKVWKKANQMSALSILGTYVSSRLEAKYRDELIKEGFQVAPASTKKK